MKQDFVDTNYLPETNFSQGGLVPVYNFLPPCLNSE